MGGVEESVSGFQVTGDWQEVVEHGERISRALRDIDALDEYEDSYEEWREWRPRMHERIESDIKDKTAEQAHIGEGEGEKEDKKAEEDIKEAGKKLSESYEKLEDDRSDAVGSWGSSIGHVKRAADTASRKALRKIEDTVYKKVMTQIAPYYFDNELISANIQQAGDEGSFVFEVNVNDDELKEQVSEQLATYEDEVDRWHVTTEKDTEQIEAAEGVETPDREIEEESRHTMN